MMTFGMFSYLVAVPLFHSAIFSLLIYFFVTDYFYCTATVIRLGLLGFSVYFADQVSEIIVFFNLMSLFATAIAFICYQQANMSLVMLYLHVIQTVASTLVAMCHPRNTGIITVPDTNCLSIFIRKPADQIELDVDDVDEETCTPGTCSICLSNLEKQIVKTKCTHLFHQECIEKWCLRRYYQREPVCCPLCRCCVRLKLYK